MNVRPLVRLASLSLFLAACYGAHEPLGPVAKGQIDSDLFGSWECRPSDETNDERATMTVMRFDEHQYYVEWREDDKVTRYRAHSSSFAGETLMNVAELTRPRKDEAWVFMRYAVTDGQLKLAVVSDKAVKDLSEKAALAAIRKRAKEDSLYEAFAVCSATS
jgi:hypothetical protein